VIAMSSMLSDYVTKEQMKEAISKAIDENNEITDQKLSRMVEELRAADAALRIELNAMAKSNAIVFQQVQDMRKKIATLGSAHPR